MAPFKNADVNLNISTKGSSKVNSSTRIVFSSQDKGTARFQFNIKNNGNIMPLNDVEGEIVLLMTGDSKFVDTARVVDAEKGIMEYILTDEQLTHFGNVFAELNLKYKDGSKIGGLEWDFSIERSKLDQVIEPSKEYYVATFEELEQDIHDRAAVIEETINQLEDGVNESIVVQVETAKKDSTGQMHENIDDRIKAEVGRINQKQEQTTAALAEITSLEFSNENVARSISVDLDATIVKQDYLGGYIEIQPDSWDGENVATDGTTKTWGFPFSLLPTERERLKNLVFNGSNNIMYIRFPLGFAYRGFRNIDENTGLAKNIGERFMGQNKTLRAWFDKIAEAGGGLAPEYWCPPPYWLTSGSYSGNNQIRAGGTYPMTTTLASIKGTDSTQYNAQINAFTDAILNDLEYLHQNVAPVRMFGLQNEPTYGDLPYGGCKYDEQTYNDVLTVLYPKIMNSTILSVYNEEKNKVKLHVASSDEHNPFSGIGKTFINNHPDWIWGYSHHSMRKASGEDNTGGADWYKTPEFKEIKGNKKNVFINEYEYFNDFGTEDFRCSNNMLHLINESVYGEAQVLHPVIHVCKPLGQTLASTNTKGYCLFAVNLNGEYGLDTVDGRNPYALSKGTATPNTWAYNSWAMFGDNLPIGAYLVGNYSESIDGGGWCAYRHNGNLYLFLANNTAEDISISISFDKAKNFTGKLYNMKHCGTEIKSKQGDSVEFVIPAYSGQVWIEKTPQPVSIVKVTSIWLNKSSFTLDVGKTEQLIHGFEPSNASNKGATWVSSNPKVATVKDGLVTGVSGGTSTISVFSNDGGHKSWCTVTVNQMNVEPILTTNGLVSHLQASRDNEIWKVDSFFWKDLVDGSTYPIDHLNRNTARIYNETTKLMEHTKTDTVVTNKRASTNITLEALVRTSDLAVTATKSPISTLFESTGHIGLGFMLRAGGIVELSYRPSAGNIFVIQTTLDTSKELTYLLGEVDYANSKIKFYVNGTLIGEKTVVCAPVENPLNINFTGATDLAIPIGINFVRLYDRVLTLNEKLNNMEYQKTLITF